MCSLINKQLLLTAYAYLFIMEQQGGQQGSEALQPKTEGTKDMYNVHEQQLVCKTCTLANHIGATICRVCNAGLSPGNQPTVLHGPARPERYTTMITGARYVEDHLETLHIQHKSFAGEHVKFQDKESSSENLAKWLKETPSTTAHDLFVVDEKPFLARANKIRELQKESDKTYKNFEETLLRESKRGDCILKCDNVDGGTLHRIIQQGLPDADVKILLKDWVDVHLETAGRVVQGEAAGPVGGKPTYTGHLCNAVLGERRRTFECNEQLTENAKWWIKGFPNLPIWEVKFRVFHGKCIGALINPDFTNPVASFQDGGNPPRRNIPGLGQVILTPLFRSDGTLLDIELGQLGYGEGITILGNPQFKQHPGFRHYVYDAWLHAAWRNLYKPWFEAFKQTIPLLEKHARDHGLQKPRYDAFMIQDKGGKYVLRFNEMELGSGIEDFVRSHPGGAFERLETWNSRIAGKAKELGWQRFRNFSFATASPITTTTAKKAGGK